MYYEVQERAGEWCVVTQNEGQLISSYKTQQEAIQEAKVLNAKESGAVKDFDAHKFVAHLVNIGHSELIPQFKDIYNVGYYAVEQAQIGKDQVNYNPLGGLSGDKACANCQWFVSPNNCIIVEGDISPTGLSDLWHETVAEQATPIPVEVTNFADFSKEVSDEAVASISNTPEILQYVKEAITPWYEYIGYKEVWTTAYVSGLPDSSFAYIDDKGERHLPFKNKEGKVDLAHARNALARLNQVKGLAGEEASKVKSKLESALNSGKKKELNLIDRAKQLLFGASHKENNGLNSDDVLPVQFFKDNTGSYRFLVRYSNMFRDREHEIFTSASHKEYTSWVDQKGIYPVARLWHVPDIDIGVCDWMEYDEANGIALASGTIYKEFNEVAENLQRIQDSIGISHGFFPIRQKGLLIYQHRSFELSFLPRVSAANIWTDTNFFNSKEVDLAMAISQQKKDWLKSIGIPDASITQLETGNKEMREALEKLGVDYKAMMDPEDKTDKGKDEDKENADGTKKKVASSASSKEVEESVETLVESKFKEFLASDTFKVGFKEALDSAVASAITPANNTGVSQNRPSQSNENIKDGRTKEAHEAQKSVDWFDNLIPEIVGVQ